MIIQIRGTHGSGKSTIVRSIVQQRAMEPFFVEGRKRPMGYLSPGLFVPGGYDSACGGCDSISKVERVFELVRHYAQDGLDVVFEGILAQHSAGRLLELHRAFPVTLIVLSTPLPVCIASVEQRRRERGDDRPLDPSNIEKEYRSVLSAARRLKGDGVKVLEMNRQDAAYFCMQETA